jgi:hypothetical protein
MIATKKAILICHRPALQYKYNFSLADHGWKSLDILSFSRSFFREQLIYFLAEIPAVKSHPNITSYNHLSINFANSISTGK